MYYNYFNCYALSNMIGTLCNSLHKLVTGVPSYSSPTLSPITLLPILSKVVVQKVSRLVHVVTKW